jgi:capsular exopolysaccharide synthesis family protein
MVQSIMQTPEHPGLVNVLAGITTLEDAIQFSEIGKFDVLTSGPVPSNPNELIGSNTMLETIRQLERDYDMVIIDTPPILPVADSLNLSVHVDGVVLVTRLGETTRDRLRRTKEALENVHATIIGAVPNGAAQREDSAYSYTYTYTDKALRKPKKTQGSPRDAEIDAHPDNLRPATRDDQTEQTAVVASTVASSTEGLSRRERRARHAAEGRRRSSAGTVPIGDTTGTSTADPLDAIDFSSKSSRNAPEKDASTDPPR